MEIVLLDNIEVEIDGKEFLQTLKIEDDDDLTGEALALLEEGENLGKPKAMYGMAYIDARGDDWVAAEGIRFSSRILSVNVREAYRLFPYVATCGTELDEWAKSLQDPLEKFWADTLCEIALRKAFKKMNEDFEKHFKPGKTAVMNPGSLADWPLSEQKQLFALLGDRIGETGIQLTDSFLMIPAKSMSGIRFPLELNFENCMLCPREDCPGRRAQYDEKLFVQRYG